MDQADAQPRPESLSVIPPGLPDKVTGTSEPMPATESGAGAREQSTGDVREAAEAELVYSRGEGAPLHLPPPKGGHGADGARLLRGAQQKDERRRDRCATREIPSGYREPIPAMSVVQPRNWDRQGVISVLRDGDSSPGRHPPQPALPLLLALLSARASREIIQTKSCCNFGTMQSLAAEAARGRGAIPSDTREFQRRLPRKAN